MTRTVPMDGFSAYLRDWEARIGSFLEIGEAALEAATTARDDRPSDLASDDIPSARSPLAGLPFAVKDNIAVTGLRLSCGSRLLEGLGAPYDATCVARLRAAGALPLGKTNMDEFGMGSSTDASAYGRTNNPWDGSRVAGGSSGGSAAAVAAGLVPFALGSDTGGSVRQPASFCGVVGLKPTYGAVSRFGLVAYASSLDTVGILADSARRARQVYEAMRGIDPLDMTSRDAPPGAPEALSPGGATIGILSPEAIAEALSAELGDVDSYEGDAGSDASGLVLEPEVLAAFKQAADGLRDLGCRLVDVRLPSLRYAAPAYYTIATAEASANLARFDGIRYGARDRSAESPEDLVDGTRRNGFGEEVRLRVLLGTFVLRSGFQDRYYLRAQRVRSGIMRDFGRALSGCDAILMPVFPTRAFGRGEAGLSPFAQKAADLLTCCANLAGLPALAFPTGVAGGLPVGAQLVGPAFSEGALLGLAEAYEAAHPIARPTGYRSYWRQP